MGGAEPSQRWVGGWVLRYAGRKSGLEQLQIARQCDRLGAAGDLELAENIVGVCLDRADGDHERSRDFGVGLAARDQARQCSPPRACRSLRAVKRPNGLLNVNVVACSSQANQAGVSSGMRLASLSGSTNVAPSTRAVVRAIRVPSAMGWGVLGMLW